MAASPLPARSAPAPMKGDPPGSPGLRREEDNAPAPAPGQAVPAPDLGGPSNLTVVHLSTLSSRLFLSHLSSIPYSKTLILDPSLAGPLGLVVDTSSLRSVGVERMFWMEARDGVFRSPEEETRGKSVSAPTKAVVYVCRPEDKWMKVIKAHINHDVAASASTASGLSHTYHALLTPHRTELSLLSLSSVLPHLNLFDFGIEFVPLDPDLLSLEEEGAGWRDLYITGDETVLHRSAMALMTCQMLWGYFPKIAGKGDLSKRLADLLIRQRREQLASDPTNPSLTTMSGVIDGLVIVERGTDMVTAMCSQLTYLGLLDEVVGIKSAHVEVDPALLSGTPTSAPPPATSSGSATPLVTPNSTRPLKKHRLEAGTDALYAQIRDLNFSTVGAVLHSFAKRLSSSYQDRHSAKTVSEMRAFVGKLGGLQNEHTALRLHTALTEKLMAETSSEIFNRSLEIQQNLVAGLDLTAQLTAIEELINLEAPLTLVLRLLCLLSTSQGGLKPKNFEYVKREICQTYGYEHLTTLLNLERAGLLVKIRPPTSSTSSGSSGAGGPAPFERVRQPLRLINDEVSESDPSDIAYVYSGYAPLSVRIVQAVGQKEALVGTVGGSGKGGLSSAGVGGEGSGPAGPLRKPRAHPLVGWKGFEDVLAAIPGETFDLTQSPHASSSAFTADETSPSPSNQQHPPPGARAPSGAGAGPTPKAGGGAHLAAEPSASTNPNAPWSSDPDRLRTTVVFFLGGITYAEIAALRFMSSQSRNRRWLIATTGIVSGGRVMDMAMQG